MEIAKEHPRAFWGGFWIACLLLLVQVPYAIVTIRENSDLWARFGFNQLVYIVPLAVLWFAAKRPQRALGLLYGAGTVFVANLALLSWGVVELLGI